jgi:hypothetical protein
MPPPSDRLNDSNEGHRSIITSVITHPTIAISVRSAPEGQSRAWSVCVYARGGDGCCSMRVEGKGRRSHRRWCLNVHNGPFDSPPSRIGNRTCRWQKKDPLAPTRNGLWLAMHHPTLTTRTANHNICHRPSAPCKVLIPLLIAVVQLIYTITVFIEASSTMP